MVGKAFLGWIPSDPVVRLLDEPESGEGDRDQAGNGVRRMTPDEVGYTIEKAPVEWDCLG